MTTDRIFHRVITDNWPQISHGKDCYLYAEDGRAYLDACAGVHVVSIGHGVPEIAAVMQEQANKVCFTYARFLTQPQIDLADKLAAMAPGDLNRVFFVSGGSEATEAALKIARKYHVETGNSKKYKVITRWQSWHGNTIGALSMSGRSTWREDYVPYLLDFPHITFPHPDHCPYCEDRPACTLACAEELERVIKQEGSEYIAAFIAEPISGTSCCGLMPPPDYFPTIRAICDRYNILMIIDEVVTAYGRTGLNFGIEHWDAIPDILATGKGLSSGVHAYCRYLGPRRDLRRDLQKAEPLRPRAHLWRQSALLCRCPRRAELHRGPRPSRSLRADGRPDAGEDAALAGLTHSQRSARQGPAHRRGVRKGKGDPHALRPRSGRVCRGRQSRLCQGRTHHARVAWVDRRRRRRPHCHQPALYH